MHGQRPAREHSGRHRGPRQTVRGLASTFLWDIYLAMHSIITKPTPTPLTNTPYALCVVAGRRGYRVWRRRRVCLEEEEWTGAAPGPPGWCPRVSRMKNPFQLLQLLTPFQIIASYSRPARIQLLSSPLAYDYRYPL